jgi:hypothetical protein
MSSQSEASKKYYWLHKEEIAQKRRGQRGEENRLYYENNREVIIKKTTERRKKSPEDSRRYVQKYRKEDPERHLYILAKTRCKKSGREFSISKEDIHIPEFCPLLGIRLDVYGRKDFCPSLDRIDNSLGYTPTNIWVISCMANRMKNTASIKELIKFSESVLKLYKDC